MSAAPSMPFSDEAEKAILSCFLQNPAVLLDDFADTMTADAFYHPAHRLIYETFQEMHGLGKVMELPAISGYFFDRGLMDKIGGNATLAELYSFTPISAHYPYYKGIVRDKAMLRKIIGTCTEGIQKAYEHQEDVSMLVDHIEQSVFALRSRECNQQRSELIKHTIMDTFDAIQDRIQRGDALTGYSTGFTWLDGVTGGIRPETWFIGARPSVGKTSLALQLILSLAVEQGIPCGFFSLEMSRRRVELRLISMLAEIPLDRVIRGNFTNEQKPRFHNAFNRLQNSPLLIDDRAGLTLAQIKAKTRRWVREYKIQAVFGDYLQRMSTDGGRKNANMSEIHSANVTGITNMGKDMEIANIWLAQLNRDCEKRPGGKPMMSDFEGCGRIEQDADLAMLLSRPKDQPKDEEIKHILFDVVKQRDGDTRERLHLFTRSTTTFGKYPIIEREEEEDPPARKQSNAYRSRTNEN